MAVVWRQQSPWHKRHCFLHFHMTYTYPENSLEKIKGTFVDANGRTVTFETPGSFNPDGTCDKAACDAAVNKLIEILNSMHRRRNVT